MADMPTLLAKCSEQNPGGAYDCKVMLMATVSGKMEKVKCLKERRIWGKTKSEIPGTASQAS